MSRRPDLSSQLAAMAAPGTRVGSLALLAIAGTVAVAASVAWGLLPLAGAVAPPPVKPVGEDRLSARRKNFAAMQEAMSKAVVDRAPFGAVRVAAAPPPPPRTSAPSRYGGPTLVGIVDNTALFGDGSRVRVGEELGEVGVVSLDPPWAAKLRWRGGEFTVTLFDRLSINVAQPLSSWGPAPAPPPAPTPRPLSSGTGAAGGGAAPISPASPAPGGPAPGGPAPGGPAPAGPSPAPAPAPDSGSSDGPAPSQAPSPAPAPAPTPPPPEPSPEKPGAAPGRAG